MDNKEIKHININVRGRVQGVGFRYSARSMARSLGVKGFVKNLPSREVYIEAEGNDLQLRDFISWCHRGPEHARVDNVITSSSDIKYYTEFEIR